MLRVYKNTGNVASSAAEKPTKSSKGRVELCVYDTLETDSEGKRYELAFTEYGNYGRVRWNTEVLVSEAEMKEMVSLLGKLLSGKLVETLKPLAEETVEVQTAATETAETAETATEKEGQ